MDDGAWSAVAAAPAADLSQDDDKPQPDARGLVPVRVVIDRVAHQAYSEFQNLVEVLPGMNNNERRRAIVDLCSELRKQLCKLKMLLEWTADAEDVHKCSEIIAKLVHQSEQLNAVTRELDNKIRFGLKNACVRSWDVQTAVEVAQAGTYRRLPKVIESLYTKSPPLSRKEVQDTLSALEYTMSIRLLATEVVPEPMRNFKIGFGRAFFRVADEFAVALSLAAPTLDGQWNVVKLDFLPCSSTRHYGHISTKLLDGQVHMARMEAWRHLVPPENTAQTSPASTRLSPPHYPLVSLYNYLHVVAISYQLEILYLQASYLVQTRLRNMLHVDLDSDNLRLSLTYWRDASPALSLSSWNTTRRARDEHRAERHMLDIKAEVPAADSAKLPSFPGDEAEVSWLRNRLTVTWSGTEFMNAAAGGPDEYPPADLKLDMLDLDVERLIVGAIECHSRMVLTMCRNRLRAAALAADPFTLDSLELVDVPAYFPKGPQTSGSAVLDRCDRPTSTVPDENMASSTLIIRSAALGEVMMSIDPGRGRVLLEQGGQSKTLASVKRTLRTIEDQLNERPLDVVELIKSCEQQFWMDGIEELALRAGFRTYRMLPVQGNDLDALQQASDHFLYLQFSAHPTYYLFLNRSKEKARAWLCELDVDDKRPSIKQTQEVAMRELDEVLARHSGPSNWNGGSMAVRCDEDAGLAMKADDEPKAEAQPGRHTALSLMRHVHQELTHRVVGAKLEAQLRAAGLCFRPAPSVTAPGTQLLSAFAVLRVADVLASRKLPASSLQRSALGDTIVVAIWKSGTGEFLNVVFACAVRRKRVPAFADLELAGLSTLEQSGERGHATLCFRFESVNSCVQRFLRAWETTFLISHLALQVIDNHQDHVTVTDWSAKRLVVGYAEEYTMEVTVCQLGNPPTAYRPQGKRRGRYKVVFGRRSAAGSQLRTPHLPFQHYVEDKLDRSHNLDRLFAYLIPTLPLLTEIERQTEENPNVASTLFWPLSISHFRVLYKRHCLDVRVLVFEPWKTGFLLLSDVTTPQPYEAGAEPASAGDAGLGRSVEKSAGSKYKPIPDASAQLKELAAGTAQSNPKESTAQPAAAAAAAAATTPAPSSNDGMVRVLQGKVICSARMAPEVYRVLLEVMAKPREGSAGPAA